MQVAGISGFQNLLTGLQPKIVEKMPGTVMTTCWTMMNHKKTLLQRLVPIKMSRETAKDILETVMATAPNMNDTKLILEIVVI